MSFSFVCCHLKAQRYLSIPWDSSVSKLEPCCTMRHAAEFSDASGLGKISSGVTCHGFWMWFWIYENWFTLSTTALWSTHCILLTSLRIFTTLKGNPSRILWSCYYWGQLTSVKIFEMFLVQLHGAKDKIKWVYGSSLHILFPTGNHIKFNFAYVSYLNDSIENIIFKCEMLLALENEDKQQIKTYSVT